MGAFWQLSAVERPDVSEHVRLVIFVRQRSTAPLRSYRRLWIWEAVAADAGLDAEVVRHTLRHTAAAWLRIARVDVRTAADLLGMSDQTAVKIYDQWTVERQDAAADALAWSHGVKAAHSFAIEVPATVETEAPRGLPPREH